MMQSSTTELELLSTSAISPLDDRRISLLFDAPGNGTYSENKRSARWSTDEHWKSSNGCARKNIRRKPRLSEAAPNWERRTVKLSLHFFYVVAIGVLICLIVYLTYLNRSIYSFLKKGESPIPPPPTARSDQLSSVNKSLAALLRSEPNALPGESPTDTGLTRRRKYETEPDRGISSGGSCPVSGNNLSSIYYKQTGVRLYVGPIANNSEALEFCEKINASGNVVQLVQFSESSKLENSREYIETLIDRWKASIWVRAEAARHNWFWIKANLSIPIVKTEIDADENAESACAVLQKRKTELRLEASNCDNRALVLCECYGS